MLERRTKIVATLGPATDSEGVLDRLVAAGLDCARLNCSHGDHDDLRRRAAEVRAASERAGRPIGLLFDLQGPKLRLSGATVPRVVAVGDAVTFVALGHPSPTPDHVVVEFDSSPRGHRPLEIVIGEGVPGSAVERIDGARDRRPCRLPGPCAAQGINVTYARPEPPATTEKDLADLALAGVGGDLHRPVLRALRGGHRAAAQLSRDLGSHAKLIAEIEKKIEAHEVLHEITAVSDGPMVARGDYGVEAGVVRALPLVEGDHPAGHP